MGHRDPALDFGVTIEPTGEANDLAHHEGQIRLHLKALFRQVRDVALIDLSLAREMSGTFDRYAVLLALLVHGGFRGACSKVGLDEVYLEDR